jgi:hypothetical protein
MEKKDLLGVQTTKPVSVKRRRKGPAGVGGVRLLHVRPDGLRPSAAAATADDSTAHGFTYRSFSC